MCLKTLTGHRFSVQVFTTSERIILSLGERWEHFFTFWLCFLLFSCFLHLCLLLQFHPLGSVEKIHVFKIKVSADIGKFEILFSSLPGKKVSVSIRSLSSPTWSGACVVLQRSRLSNVVGGLALLSDLVECLPLENQANSDLWNIGLSLICSCLWYMSYTGGEEKQTVTSKNDFKGNMVFFSLLEDLLFSLCSGEPYQ